MKFSRNAKASQICATNGRKKNRMDLSFDIDVNDVTIKDYSRAGNDLTLTASGHN